MPVSATPAAGPNSQSPSYGENWAQQLGIPNISGDLMPAFGSGDRNSPTSIYGMSGAAPNRNVNETISFRDDLSFIRGTHAFKMGYELLRFRLNSAVLRIRCDMISRAPPRDCEPNGVATANTAIPSPDS